MGSKNEGGDRGKKKKKGGRKKRGEMLGGKECYMVR